jgi:predicted permease
MGWSPSEMRFLLRRLLRTPGFTAIAVITLAVGIGANTAIFSVVDGVLLRPLPYPESENLVGLWHSGPGIGIPQFEQSNTSYTVYREHTRSFEGIAMYGSTSLNLTSSGEPLRLTGAQVTASLFPVLRASPARGRVFVETDDDVGAPRVVILSDQLWKTRFGSDQDIVGRTLQLDGEAYEVIGVMPADFRFPYDETQLWIPHVIPPEVLGLANFSYIGIGRLKEGISLEAATADLNRVLPRMPELYPGELTAELLENAGITAFINPMKNDIVGDVGTVLWILLGTVGFILIIACANVANLFLVRAEGRQKETAVRTALGAGRGDLFRTYLAESTALSLMGGVLGVGLATVGVRTLVAMGPENLPRLGEIGLHGSVLLFTLGISLVAGLLFGAVPVFKYGRPDLANALKEGGRGGSVGRERHRLNNALVATQVALALMLLVGSGLMARSFFELKNVDPGFRTEGVLTLRLSLPNQEYPDDRQMAESYRELAERVRGLPGVQEVGLVTNLPTTDGNNNAAMVVEDLPLQEGDLPPIVRTNVASDGYFEAMGVRLVEGRTFEPADYDSQMGVAIVSSSTAERYWPGESAVGKRISPALPQNGEVPWFEIVGVVGEVRDDGLALEAPAMVYYAMATSAEGVEAGDGVVYRTMSLAVRTSGDPLSLSAAVRNEVWGLDSRLPVANMRTTGEIARESAARTTFTMVMLGIAAAMALLLGMVGVYGVLSYVVSQRTREFGVRLAMGAREGQIRGMVVRQGLTVAAVGVAAGLAGGFALTRLMKALLFGVSATDPFTFGGVAVLLLAVSALAAYLPARRASSVSPVEALRHD